MDGTCTSETGRLQQGFDGRVELVFALFERDTGWHLWDWRGIWRCRGRRRRSALLDLSCGVKRRRCADERRSVKCLGRKSALTLLRLLLLRIIRRDELWWDSETGMIHGSIRIRILLRIWLWLGRRRGLSWRSKGAIERGQRGTGGLLSQLNNKKAETRTLWPWEENLKKAVAAAETATAAVATGVEKMQRCSDRL